MNILKLLEATATGAGRHVVDLTEGLLARGHQVDLLYSPLRCDQVFLGDLQRLAEHPNFRSLSVPIRHCPCTDDVRVVWRLRRYLCRYGPFDVVHNHSTKAGWIGRLGLLGHSTKRLYTPHGFVTMNPETGPLTGRLAAGIEAVLATLSAGVIVVSREEYAHAARLGIDGSKLCVIPNGVAPAQSSNSERDALRREWGLAEHELCIGFVGRLSPIKAPHVMLDAFAELRRRCDVPVRLIMVGDGPLAEALRRQATTLGIDQYIVWLGARWARPLMPGFDIFALTSHSEGHPLVVLEAMFDGLPIVATSVGGIADTVQHGVNGFIAPVGDSASISAELQKLASDRALRESMGRASRAISSHFSTDLMVDRTVALYQQVVSGTWNGDAAPSWCASPSR